MTDKLLPPQEKAGTPGVDPSPLVASGVPSPTARRIHYYLADGRCPVHFSYLSQRGRCVRCLAEADLAMIALGEKKC